MVGCAAPMMCSRSHFHIVWQDEKTICKVDDNNKQKAQARGNEALHLRYVFVLRIVGRRILSHNMMCRFSSGPARFWSRSHQNNPDLATKARASPPVFELIQRLWRFAPQSLPRFRQVRIDSKGQSVGLRLRRSVTPLPTVPSRPSAALFVGRRTIADSTPALCYTYSIPIEHILCLSDLAESPIPDAKTRRREGQHGGCRIERTSAEQKEYFLDIRSKRPLTIELKACRGGQSIAEDSCWYCPPKGKFRRAAPKSSSCLWCSILAINIPTRSRFGQGEEIPEP